MRERERERERTSKRQEEDLREVDKVRERERGVCVSKREIVRPSVRL